MSDIIGEMIERQEEAQDLMCKEAAQKAGHDGEDAEECDDGELRCPECPWADNEKGPMI